MYTSDQEVIKAIRLDHQKESALRWVYHECAPMVRQLGWSYSLSEEDWKDALQEAVVVFWQKVVNTEFVLTSKISTYIYQICKNKFHSRTRNEKKAVFVDIDSVGDTYEAEIDNEEDDASNTVKLAMYLNELGERCRNLIQGYYSGLSMKVLANKYEYSNPETATAQKYKCLMQLRKKFENPLR